MHDNVSERLPDFGFGRARFVFAYDVPGVVRNDDRFQAAVGSVCVERDSLWETLVGARVGFIPLHDRCFHTSIQDTVLALNGEHVVHGLNRGFGEIEGRRLSELSLTGKRQDGKRRNACHPE